MWQKCGCGGRNARARANAVHHVSVRVAANVLSRLVVYVQSSRIKPMNLHAQSTINKIALCRAHL